VLLPLAACFQKQLTGRAGCASRVADPAADVAGGFHTATLWVLSHLCVLLGAQNGCQPALKLCSGASHFI
jgi:hypothetical protein